MSNNHVDLFRTRKELARKWPKWYVVHWLFGLVAWCCKKDALPASIASIAAIGSPASFEQKRHIRKIKWDEQKRCMRPIYWGQGRHAFIFYASLNRRPIEVLSNYNRNSALIMNAAAFLLSASTQKKLKQLHQSIVFWWQDLSRKTWSKLASTSVRSDKLNEAELFVFLSLRHLP